MELTIANDAQVMAKMNRLDRNVKCAGIAVNMANRALEEMHECCERYQTSKGVRSSASLILLAIVFHRHIKKNDATFYNALTVIGRLPTKEIDYIDIYAYAWLKILEESDKECSGRTHD